MLPFANRLATDRRIFMQNAYLFRCSALIIFLLSCPSHVYCGQVVKIRLINEQDCRPLKNQPMSISLLYDEVEKAPSGLELNLSRHTDANGEFLLRLPEPNPAHFGAQIRLTSHNWRCACSALLTTQDVITKGFTVMASTRKSVN